MFAIKHLTFILLVAVASFDAVHGALSIPNAENVTAGAHYWPAVGKTTPRGSSLSRDNAFGAALIAAGNRWTADLCRADTDGDGYTNGEELGDPDCVWTPGATPARVTDITHPGLAQFWPVKIFTRRSTALPACTRDNSNAVPLVADEVPLLATTVEVPGGLTRLERFSELVKIRTMSAEQRPTRTNCPWAEGGLRDWHDPLTWGGAVPAPGQQVVLPQNTRVLISSCSLYPEGYGSVTVPASSALVFADAPIELRLKDLYVSGTLQIGSESCTMQSPVTISFFGDKSERQTYGNGLVVSNSGRALVYGAPTNYTWTRLAANAPYGSMHILLQDPVSWTVGDRIFVTTSIWKDHIDNQNEVRIIDAVSPDGMTVLLNRPLNYDHYAGIEFQTEVGVLTRSVMFRGDGVNMQRDKYGGHTMAQGNAAVYKMYGVGARNMGQQNVLARYPFHMHLMNEAETRTTAEQLLCHECYFRCISIHRTNRTRLLKSVAFNGTAHTFYLEDGAEMFNNIHFNLAAHIWHLGKAASGGSQGGERFSESAEAIQPADHTASGFYIPNPHNYLHGNAASGGWAGYAFPVFDRPLALSSDIDIEPKKYPLLEFDANTAHSSGYYWGDAGCIYQGGKLWQENGRFEYTNGRHSQPTRGSHFLTNVRVWMCQRGFSSWGDRVELVDYEAHDVSRSAVLFGTSSITNMLVTGSSPAAPSDMIRQGRQGFGFYDTWVRTTLTNSTFRNYFMRPGDGDNGWARNGVIVDLTHSDIFKPWGISATRDIRLENVNSDFTLRRWVRETGASRMFNVVDWDGSLLRAPICKPYIVGAEVPWWLANNDCFYKADWDAHVCPRVHGREVVGLDADLWGLQQQLNFRTDENDVLNQIQRDQLYLGHISQFAPHGDRRLIITRNHHLATGLSGIGWYMYVKFGMPENVQFTPQNFPRGAYIVLAIPYPPGTVFAIRAEKRWGRSNRIDFKQATSRQAVADSNGTYYHFDGTHLYLKISDMWTPYPNAYSRKGVDIYGTMGGSRAYYIINASCPTKTSAGLCTPPAAPNPPPYMNLTINRCSKEEDVDAIPSLCPDEPNVPEGEPDANCDTMPQWKCNIERKPNFCRRRCLPNCTRLAPYPYVCSYEKQCDTANFRKPLDSCSTLNDMLYTDPCNIRTCNHSFDQLGTIPAPAGTPCTGSESRFQVDGTCRDTGECALVRQPHNVTIARVGSSADRIDVAVVPSTDITGVGVEYETTTGAEKMFIGGSVQLVRERVTSGDGSWWGAKVLRSGPPHAVVRTVHVTVTHRTKGKLSRVFADWNKNAHVVPRIEVTKLSVVDKVLQLKVTPPDWVEAVELRYGVESINMTCAGNKCEAKLTDSAATATEGSVKLYMRTAVTVKHTIPCWNANAGDSCTSRSITVRKPLYRCLTELFFVNGNRWWLTLRGIPGREVQNIEVVGRDPIEESEWRRGQFAGRMTPSIENATSIHVTRTDGRVEVFEIDRVPGDGAISTLPGNRLPCKTGYALPPSDEVGRSGSCTSSVVPQCIPEERPIPGALAGRLNDVAGGELSDLLLGSGAIQRVRPIGIVATVLLLLAAGVLAL